MAQSAEQTRPMSGKREQVDSSASNLRAIWERHHLAFAVFGNTLFLILGWITAKMDAPAWSIFLYVLAYVSGGIFSLREGVESLVKERRIDVDLLMVTAAVAAASIGEWIEGGILLFLFSLSNAMQFYAMDRTRRAITALMSVRPREALVKREDGGLELIPVDRLAVGNVIVVRPGELVPIDGVIVSGFSSLEEAAITGESVPADKGVGDEVFGGTLNENGALEVRVTKLADDTVIAKIIRMVEEAQSEESPTKQKIDRIEQYYAVGVIGLTLVAAVVPVMFGQTWSDAVYRAITLMVVASPCAVAMAVPAPVVASIANGARSGILYKGGVHVENMAEVEVIAFDKTGTLTEGRLEVTDVVSFGTNSREDVLSLAAAVESRSEHPIARAVLQAAEKEAINYTEPFDTQAIPGQGVTATVDGVEVWVGNERLMDRKTGVIPEEVLDVADDLMREGKTVMFVGKEDELIGVAAVVDQVRPGVVDMIDGLKEQGIKRVVMLTGDNVRVAEAVAAQVGIDEVHAGLLPDEKAEMIRAMREKYGRIAMVGDGVNDAPALAQASVGIAMGAAGSDVALETADVVLMSNDLGKINHAVTLSRRTKKVIWQNLTFSLGVIGLLVMIVLSRGLLLAVGVVGHEGSTVVVIINSLRLLFGQHRTHLA